MKTFDSIEATISHNLKDPLSKSLEPDCLSPFVWHYDTVSYGEEEVMGLFFLPCPFVLVLLSRHGVSFFAYL